MTKFTDKARGIADWIGMNWGWLRWVLCAGIALAVGAIFL